MSQPFLGEIRMVGFNFAPRGWALCNGAVLPISTNQALFAVLGTTYGGNGNTTFGGDGVNTFGLPDLRGRLPVHQGSAMPMGQMAGSESVTLTSAQMPAHTHTLHAQAESGTQASPGDGLWARSNLGEYTNTAPTGTMNPNAITAAGGSLPHDNLMPFLAISFIIALEGIYPSQN